MPTARTTPIALCGSRTWTDQERVRIEVERLLKRYGDALLIRHGDEPNGADECVRKACEALGVRHIQYCAARPRYTPHSLLRVVWVSDWNSDGNAAGPIRNRAMRDDGIKGLVAFRMPGVSRGTDGMCALARERDIPVIIRTPKEERG
jgi:hypothetical protein